MQILLDSFNKRPLDHNAHLRIIPWQSYDYLYTLVKWRYYFPFTRGFGLSSDSRKTLFTKGRFLLSLVEFDPVILEMNMS